MVLSGQEEEKVQDVEEEEPKREEEEEEEEIEWPINERLEHFKRGGRD